MSRANGCLALLVLLVGTALMIDGDRLTAWAVGAPTGDAALFVAVSRGDCRAARRAIRAGANVHARSNSGHTPLHIAAGSGDETMVACLLAHGATVDALEGRGMTALSYAVAQSGDVGVIRALLDAGADVNGGPGCTVRPLDSAVIRGRSAAAELLHQRGATSHPRP